jgi:hypothetical protein
VFYWKRNNWLFYLPRFFSSYENVKINKPIFFLGNQGDGLTLTSRMVRRHPDIVCITGNSNYWTGADEMQIAQKGRLPISLTFPKSLPGEPGFEHFVPLRSYTYACNNSLPFYRKTAKDVIPSEKNVFRKLIREAVNRFARDKNSARFVDKSQIFTVKLSFIFEMIKDSNPYFILVSRNPYATCYRAALKFKELRTPDLTEPLKICCEHWNNSMTAALEDSKTVPHFYHVRFEDILSKTESELIKICNFLQLDFRKDMVPSAEHKLPLGSKYEERWYPLNPKINDRYLKELPEDYKKIIASICGPVAEKLGYSMPE